MSATVTDRDTRAEETGTASRSVLARLLLALLWVYQRTAVARTPRCRFHPTCSTYAVEAIRVHGALRGAGYASRRVGRCHPWHPGGIDPVPPPHPRKSDS